MLNLKIQVICTVGFICSSLVIKTILFIPNYEVEMFNTINL